MANVQISRLRTSCFARNDKRPPDQAPLCHLDQAKRVERFFTCCPHQRCRRNFYNKMRHLGMLDQAGSTANPSQKKEAFLLHFNKAKYEELKQKGFRLVF